MKKRYFASLFEPIAFCTACWFGYTENYQKAICWMLIAIWCAVTQITQETNIKAYIVSPEEYKRLNEQNKGGK
jgi:hypothetical protein